jgi:hypothetical protein
MLSHWAKWSYRRDDHSLVIRISANMAIIFWYSKRFACVPAVSFVTEPSAAGNAFIGVLLYKLHYHNLTSVFLSKRFMIGENQDVLNDIVIPQTCPRRCNKRTSYRCGNEANSAGILNVFSNYD